MRPKQVQHRIRVDLGVIAMKDYSTQPTSSKVDLYHQIQFNVILRTPLIGLVGRVRVFANDPEERGSIPRRVIPKTFKMVLDTSLLYTKNYKVCIKGKVEQSRERINTLPNTLV